MRGPNDFWLSYNQLVEAYKAEGATTEARTENIVEQFRRMPASVRQHIVEDIKEFLSVMVELHVSVRAEADDAPPRSIKRHAKG